MGRSAPAAGFPMPLGARPVSRGWERGPTTRVVLSASRLPLSSAAGSLDSGKSVPSVVEMQRAALRCGGFSGARIHVGVGAPSAQRNA